MKKRSCKEGLRKAHRDSAVELYQKPGPAGQKSILRSLKDIFSAFPIPSPALALPLLLVVGIAAGYFYPADSTVPLPEGTQVAELIYYDEGFYE